MSVEHLSLCRCRVLYLGSAIPLETAVGIEALQAPCRDRYSNVDSNQQASGIDSSLAVFSSGLMLQYAADAGSTTWFPIQSLHVCAAVKAVQSNGPPRFVSLDTAAAMQSSNPPLFACIMRRTKGVKVLECHVFVCKSNQAAMALVQSCTHAFQHKEGWVASTPPSLGTRLVSGGFSDSVRAKPRGGLDRGDLVQRFDVSCSVTGQPKAPPQQTCLQPMVMQQTPCGPMMVPVNPPGAPVPMMGGGQYFADWNEYGGQPLMIIPESPFYPGDGVIRKKGRRGKKKSKKKKTKEDDSDEEETIFVKRSQLNQGSARGGRRVRVEETIVPPQAPQVIYMPQPKNDVHVYAPKLIDKERNFTNFQYDGSDRHRIDYHPDDRNYQYREDARRYDGRQDNRAAYNAQDFRRADYRQDARRMDYRGGEPGFRAEEEYYGSEDGGGSYYDDEFQRGYYNAQMEAYNQGLEEGEDDDGYYPEEYYPQPGYTDDYAAGDYQRFLPPGGYGGGGYAADYSQQLPAPGGGFVQVADGLGYYP